MKLVRNAIAQCNQVAYVTDLMGIDPDVPIQIDTGLPEERDGPMPEHRLVVAVRRG